MPKSKQPYLQNYSRGGKELKKGELLYEGMVERRKDKWTDQWADLGWPALVISLCLGGISAEKDSTP